MVPMKMRGKPAAAVQLVMEQMKDKILEDEEIRKEFLNERNMDPNVIRRARNSLQATCMYM